MPSDNVLAVGDSEREQNRASAKAFDLGSKRACEGAYGALRMHSLGSDPSSSSDVEDILVAARNQVDDLTDLATFLSGDKAAKYSQRNRTFYDGFKNKRPAPKKSDDDF
ncbi:hypothetical protein [Fimbriiglobus ruber]|nr:hypothetical protein [Fimbriiglobus ruber]